MEKLKKGRRPQRTLMTKLINECNALLAVDPPDKEMLRIKLQNAVGIQCAIEDLNQKIMDAMLDDNASDIDMDLELEQVSQYRENYFTIKSKIDQLVDDRSRSPTPSEYSSAASGTGQKKTFKLPKIELKSFNGELKDWLSWWSQFQKIDEDEELHESDKFQYLLQAMVVGSKARDVVESYPQTAANYPKAVNALKERFGKSELLIEVYVRELLSLIIQNVKCKEQFNLSKVYDRLESQLRALESLGITSDKFDAILFPMVESCFSIPIMRAWQRSMFSKDIGQDKTRLNCFMEFILAEVESEMRITLASEGFGLKEESISKARKERKPQTDEEFPHTAAGLVNEERRNRCVFCGNQHRSQDCGKAQSMSMEAKKEILQKNKCCFLCFRSNHISANCRAYVRCVICGNRHQALMCPDLPSHTLKEDGAKCEFEPEDNTAASCSSHGFTEVVLQTVMVNIKNGNRVKSVRALFDTGSQRSHILKATALELGLKSHGDETITHILFGGVQAKNVAHKKYEIILEKHDNQFQCIMTVLDQEKICGFLPSVKKGDWMKPLSAKNIKIQDVANGNKPIEILIGADFYGKLQTGRMEQVSGTGLTAVETRFGWTVMGQLESQKRSTITSMVVSGITGENVTIPDLWKLETIGIRDPIELKTKEEKERAVVDYFQKNIIQSNEGRYEVKLPWTNGVQSIPDNRQVAEKRLRSTTRKLLSMGKYDDYDLVFNEWVNEGIIEAVNDEKEPLKCHYLPHRPVFKEESVTTKVRPVFDASCKTGRAPSLNDCLEKGPNLIDLIPSVLLRFRENKIGVISDIRKAFLMIDINKKDRDFLRFLWWENYDTDTTKVYRHKRVVFGVNCSPFLLCAVIEHHLSKYSGPNQSIAEKLQKSLYVDNCVTSVSSAEGLEKFRKVSTEMLLEARMELRMWQDSYNVQHDMEERIVPVLGMKWDRFEDTLYCETNASTEKIEEITKRRILSLTQKIFDPLGILSPFTLTPKLMLQEAWMQKRGWDETLNEATKLRFQDWINQLHYISSIKIPRCFTGENCNGVVWSLHTFCDASNYAYAAITYMRCESENGVKVQLLQAKSRVAPLKKSTIPRLELLACTIGSRLSASIYEALRMHDVEKYFWSDSTTALAWIKRNDDWGTFVGNRVREILKLTKPSEWRHVPGSANPADLPSRGCSARKLKESSWWEGPAWLLNNSATWPGETYPEVDETEVLTEKKKVKISCINTNNMERPWYMFRTSDYGRMLRQASYVFRFLDLFMKKKSVWSGNLTAEEVEKTEKRLIRIIQSETFLQPLKLRQVDVVKGEDGLLRVKTKITMREDEYSFRYPMLLPSKHPFVAAIITYEHLKTGHGGTQFLISRLREKFWILQTRTSVNSVIHKCVRCRRFAAQSVKLSPAPLPADRVQDACVFEVVGVDLAGPLFLKEKKKSWIVLYTCAVYRAIHLELVTSLDTSHFLQSFRRFVARRGRPRIVYSDNGTNFRGSVNLFRAIDWERIRNEFLVEPIQWKFNPPSAAWWGGFWERLIRSVKGLLLRIIGKSSLLYEELVTVLCDVESVINQRPLTYVTEDGHDLIPLTPAMFIQGTSISKLPEVDVIDGTGFQKRYRYRQHLLEQLRERFRKEYLGILVQKSKDEKERQLNVGDIVLIGNDFKKRLDWPMGKILEMYPGRDGKQRLAKLKTQQGELKRPVQRLYPLEVASHEQAEAFEEKAEETGKESELIDTERQTRSGRRVRMPDRLSYS